MNFKKLKIRLVTCYRILFRKYDHWAVVSIDKGNLGKLLNDENFSAHITHHGTQHYVTMKMIKKVGEVFTWQNMTLEKAKFQYEAEEAYKKGEEDLV